MTDAPPLGIHRDGRLVELTIHRPRSLNAINLDLMGALEDALDGLSQELEDPTTAPLALILASTGRRAFISGGDLRELQPLTSAAEAFEMASRMSRILERLESLPLITIAAIDGDAYGGGCETLVACDLRVAHPEARLGWTQIRFGLTPGWGGATRLADIVGRRRALLWLTTGAVIPAREAADHGLIEILAGATSDPAIGAALDHARRLAHDIAAQSPLAIRALKAILSPGTRPEHQAEIRRERERFTALWASEDHHAAVKAFFEKREHTWTGR